MDPKKAAAELETKFREQTVGYLTAAFGLVAGLAWNDAVKMFIEEIYPTKQNTIVAKFLYAVLITLVIVLISSSLNRWAKKPTTDGDKK